MSKKFLQALSLSCAIVCVGGSTPSYGTAPTGVAVSLNVPLRPSTIAFPVKIQFTTSKGVKYSYTGSSNSKELLLPVPSLPSNAHIKSVRIVQPGNTLCTMKFKPGTSQSAYQVTLTPDNKCVVTPMNM